MRVPTTLMGRVTIEIGLRMKAIYNLRGEWRPGNFVFLSKMRRVCGI